VTANGFPSSGPPDTDLRPPSGLSPSMTLPPATLAGETKQPRASRPRRPAPHRARQADHRHHEPARPPAGNGLAPSRRHDARGLPSRHPETGAAVSGPALRRSTRTPQTRLAPPTRRAPPGQRSGQPPGSSWDPFGAPVLMPPSLLRRLNGEHPAGRAIRDRALSAQRPPGPRLTPPRRPSPDRSPRQSSANAARDGL
jgi:hypothetical protein